MRCAEQHFGKTLHQWREERRAELRLALNRKREEVAS
jgi:hypothetical protein